MYLSGTLIMVVNVWKTIRMPSPVGQVESSGPAAPPATALSAQA